MKQVYSLPTFLLLSCSLLIGCEMPVSSADEVETISRNASSLGSQESPPIQLLFPGQDDIADNGCTDYSDTVDWIYDWTDVRGADYYHLFVIGPNALNPVIDKDDLRASIYHRKSRSSFLGSGFGWKWKVRVFKNGEWSAWTPEMLYEVEPVNTDCPELDS